jgi:precorrin-2 dehydrogenase/sirohydrochlorin ferrochelatase
MAWLPVMLRLDGVRCVVVGGGAVAERKVAALLKAAGQNGDGLPDGQAVPVKEPRACGGPDITVISPEATEKLKLWAATGLIRWAAREFREEDLAAAALVFAATDAREVNERAAARARAAGAWVNAADDPAESVLIMPSVVRRGKLVLAVSTAGASPSVARRIRRELEERYGAEYETWLDWLAEARLTLRRCVAETERRQELHRELERLDVPSLLRRGALPDGWQQAWLAALEREPAPETVRRLAEML